MLNREYEKWLNGGFITQAEREELLNCDAGEIEDRFYAPLSFGTAGLRGVMGMGINRMNVYVVRQTTQAFANIIKKEDKENRGVAIAYDSRNCSALYAKSAAEVLAANGIPVMIFDALRPTPELSFTIRHYGLVAGINITASHNPKQYNGYKVYWSDGAQLPPKQASEISEEMKKTDIFTGIIRMDYNDAVKAGKITVIGSETDEEYYRCVLAQRVSPSAAENAEDMKFVFTPFHGAGAIPVTEVLKRAGYKNVICVKEQMKPDGEFPTVKSPNPEDKEGFYLAIDLAKKNDVDVIIGTDPDSDRCGIVVKNSDGEYVPFTGNQVGVLLADYILSSRKRNDTLPKNAAVLKSLVSSEMVRVVAQSYNVPTFDTFTGFKFLAEKIAQFESDNSHKYVFAYEESYGYLVGDYARDKDAVVAALLIAEMAAYYRAQNKTLYDRMNELYEIHGNFKETTVSVSMTGIRGMERMREIMKELKSSPPEEFAGLKALYFTDYMTGIRKNTVSGESEQLSIMGSNVLYFELEEDTRLIIRPSGTEPKIKVYIMLRDKDKKKLLKKEEALVQYAKSIK